MPPQILFKRARDLITDIPGYRDVSYMTILGNLLTTSRGTNKPKRKTYRPAVSPHQNPPPPTPQIIVIQVSPDCLLEDLDHRLQVILFSASASLLEENIHEV